MNLRYGLYGMHQNSKTNTTNAGLRSFSFGKYMSNTSDWTALLGFAVTSMPATFSMSVYWFCSSMRDSGNAESRTTVRSAVANFTGYGWSSWTTTDIMSRGNGINQAGDFRGNGYNTAYIYDWAYAGSPIYVTYHVDALCSNWDSINVNY